MLPAPVDHDPPVGVRQHLHPAREHGPQHVVVFGQRAHRGVEQAAADVQLDVARGGRDGRVVAVVAVAAVVGRRGGL